MEKNNLKKLFIIQIMIILISLSSAFSANYYFQIEIDHDFDDSDEITCEVIYDGRDKTWVIDEDSDRDDLELEKSIDDMVEMDCDEDLDEFTLRIYEYGTDDRVFRETYTNEDKFEYELDLVDKDEEWFSIEIDHNFDNSIDCELTIDGKEYDYEFDSDTDSDDLTIEKNYDDDIIFTCDDEFDEIEFIVYDDDEVEIYTKTYEENDDFEFENSDLDDKYELKISIDHDFDGDEISCDLIVDGVDDYNFDFDEDSSSSDLIIYEFFADNFEFDCNDDLDEIDLYIYDENGDKIDSKNYNDEDKFEYELNKGNYELFIEITNEFDDTDEIECDLIIDGEKEEDYELDIDSSIGDLRIEYEFNNDFKFICEEEMDKFLILIFNNDEYDDDQIDEKTVTHSDRITYNVNFDEEPEETIEEETIEEETIEEETIEEENDNSNQNDIELEDITQAYENQNEDLNNEDSLNSNTNDESNDLNSNKEKTIDEIIIKEENKDSNQNVSIFGIVLIIIVFIIVVYIIIANKEILFDSKPKNKNKEKVNLDFLKKR